MTFMPKILDCGVKNYIITQVKWSNLTVSHTMHYDKLPSFLSAFHPFSLTGFCVWIKVLYSCININVIPWGEFGSPGLDTIIHLGPK